MGLSLVVETGDSIRDGAGESVGIGEGAIGELILLEVAPASLDVIQLGCVFRQPFEGQPGARGERLCCQLAGVIGPLSRTAISGLARSVVPYAAPSWSSRATKSVERLVALVCTSRRRRSGSKAPSIASFFAWPGAWMRNPAPRRAQQRAR